eukprot:g10108.t1
MAAPPTRRRSFLTLPSTLKDDRPRGLKTHRSLASVRTAIFDGSTSISGSTSGSSQPTPAAERQPQERGCSARRVLGTAALALISFAAGSWRSSASGEGCSANNGAAYPPGIDFHPNGNTNNETSLAGLAPPDPRNRPFYDLVVAVLAIGGDSEEAQEEIARVRRVYARYGDGEVVHAGGGSGAASTAPPLTFRVVFVVGRAGLPDGVELPGAGLLLGDFYHVDVREGYSHLSDKTRAMAGLAEHLRFRFLAKTDGDTFPCLSRATQQLLELPEEQQPRVYAGMLNKCGTVFPKGHKLHDPEFLAATGGTIDCHPMYHQGAFYILGEAIVNHLNRSRDMLTVMSVEDAMMGLWLLGVDKVILDIGGSFYCKCFTQPVPQKKLPFYHFCKTDEKMDACIRDFGAC